LHRWQKKKLIGFARVDLELVTRKTYKKYVQDRDTGFFSAPTTRNSLGARPARPKCWKVRPRGPQCDHRISLHGKKRLACYNSAGIHRRAARYPPDGKPRRVRSWLKASSRSLQGKSPPQAYYFVPGSNPKNDGEGARACRAMSWCWTLRIPSRRKPRNRARNAGLVTPVKNYGGRRESRSPHQSASPHPLGARPI